MGFILLMALFFVACNKDETEIVKNNTAPIDSTINITIVETYINRSYISLLGRKPDSAEFSNAFQTLKQNNTSVAQRNLFIQSIFTKTDYNKQLFDINHIDLLNQVDTNEFEDKIMLFNFLLTDSTYAPFWSVFTLELNRIFNLQNAIAKLQQNQISIQQLHMVMVDNYFYDQINMGALNFVTSLYQHFLRRYPTVQELDAGIDMVNDKPATVFQQNGSNKNDFIFIFFNATDYYEGQVRDLYLRYLFREPTTAEMVTLTNQYKSQKNYKNIQQYILTSDEYLGK
ncbi:MAG TPA: hypothetical protein PLO59_00685 [Bacteroidia bacterium]|nr:hypothetical protein [Bacteroidia bacterium]